MPLTPTVRWNMCCFAIFDVLLNKIKHIYVDNIKVMVKQLALTDILQCTFSQYIIPHIMPRTDTNSVIGVSVYNTYVNKVWNVLRDEFFVVT